MKSIDKVIELKYLYVLVVLDLTISFVPYLPVFEYAGAFVLLGLLLPVYYDTGIFFTRSFVLLALYSIVVFVNTYNGDAYFDTYMVAYREMYDLYIPFTMFFLILKRNDWQLCKWILITFIIGVIYTIMASTAIEMVFPGTIRGNYGDGIVLEESGYGGFYKSGLARYSFVHAIPVLIPAFIMAYKDQKREKKQRFFWLLLSVGCVFLTYLSQAAAPLLVALAVFILSMLINVNDSKAKNRKRILIVSIIVLPFVLSSSIQLRLLDIIDDLINHEGDFHIKVLEMQHAINAEDISQTDVGFRMTLYTESLTSAVQNLLFGINSQEYGGHSALFDRFAVLGLVGIVPLSLFLMNVIKNTKRCFSSTGRQFYAIGVAAGFIILLTKNSYSWDMWLFLLAIFPMLLMYFSTDD